MKKEIKSFVKRIKQIKTKRRLIEEQNEALKGMVIALNRYTDRADSDHKNSIQITEEKFGVLQSTIPTETDIERIVQERLELEKKEELFQQQYEQFTPEARQDIDWTKDFFQVDKYKALDYYVQLFKRFQKRNEDQTQSRTEQ